MERRRSRPSEGGQLIVHSVLFSDTPTGAIYERMARVLEYTIGVNSPATPFVLHRVTEPDEDLIEAFNCRPLGRKQVYLDNARKMKHHCRIVQEAQDGEICCLIDLDVMVLGDLSEANDWMSCVGIGVTARPDGSTYPVNTGVMFVRIGGDTRHFFRHWFGTVKWMLADVASHVTWKARFGGINQSALGYLMSKDVADNANYLCIGTEVPCSTWNCEGDCQKRQLFSDQTKVVHVHGNLRRVLFNHEPPKNDQIKQLAERWREYEQAAIGVVV
jgi:hypothetical protein